MRLTKDYSFTIDTSNEEAIKRIDSVTSEKASIKNSIKSKKYYGKIYNNSFDINSMREWVNFKGGVENNTLNLKISYNETDKKSIVIGFRILAYIFIAIFAILFFVFKDNIVGNIIFISAMVVVSELIVVVIKFYQKLNTIDPDIYAKEIENLLKR